MASNERTSQSQKTIRVDHCETYALIKLNQEAQRYSQMLDELSLVLAELREDKAARVVILTGTDKVFSAGADVAELAGLTAEQAKHFASTSHKVVSQIINLGRPVIAAVNGLASGDGCELALACAWRIASPQARFVFSKTSRGLIPGFGAVTLLTELIGKARALEVILTGNTINAEEALRIGLINRVVDDSSKLVDVCEELAHQISHNAPLAIQYALEAVNHGSEVSLSDGLRFESALFGLCFATEDVHEGTKAFLEKRQPVFKGK